jgi:hypothetical protein
MVDTPGFPDGNTAMFIDSNEKLWLFWPLILANSWESCYTQYLTADNYQGDGAPQWSWRGAISLKPQNFRELMVRELEERLKSPDDAIGVTERRISELKPLIEDKLATRLGWQPRCKPTVLPSGRILLPLYTDTFSVSIMAISDDAGKNWYAGEPLVGFGNIQPAVLRKQDGTLVAYMREAGPLRKVRVAASGDDGITWGEVGTIDLPNPGSGLDAVRLANGHWVLIYNDTNRGRRSLAVSLSDDEGQTWKWTRHLERRDAGSYHYPAVIQARDGTIHAVYSYFVAEGKTMKHAAFNEAWIRAGDQGASN